MFALLVPLAEQQAQEAPTWGPLMPLLFIIFFGIFFLYLPARRERQRQAEMRGGLKKRDKVVTTSGIIGVVDNIKDEEVSLKIDENSPVRLRVIKASIDRVLVADEANKDKEKEEG
jgi:preprotein translocase subunit YajC